MQELVDLRNRTAMELEKAEGALQKVLASGVKDQAIVRKAEALRNRKRSELENLNYLLSELQQPTGDQSSAKSIAEYGSNMETVVETIKRQFAIRQSFTMQDLKNKLPASLNGESLRAIIFRLGRPPFSMVEYVRKGVGKRPSVWRRVI
jgi:hypothetical protein